MEKLSLFKNFKERFFFLFFFSLIFSLNIYIEFLTYKKVTRNEVYQINGIIVNVYDKQKYQTLKIKSKDFTFFTSYYKNKKVLIDEKIELLITTKELSFISFLQGFYTNSFNIKFSKNILDNKKNIYNSIEKQHQNKDLSSLYNALYLATPLTSKIRELSSNLGISHLIAISGFHLSVISLVLYFILHILYKPLHNRLFPYRNKRYDILILTSVILLVYLLFIDMPPSLLRAFIMFIFALFLIRNNIKIISFETLFIISIIIISLFPKLLFSLSLWFSITGVFYIFLFIKYFNKLNKIVQLIVFNFWLYLAINPITHYFFSTTTIEQLYSPIITILFTFFYPISILLHLLNLGGLLDVYLEYFSNINFDSIDIYTPIYFFVLYVIVSLLSIFKKSFFLLLNFLMIFYNIWVFQFVF